jgi:hypothetical protein
MYGHVYNTMRQYLSTDTQPVSLGEFEELWRTLNTQERRELWREANSTAGKTELQKQREIWMASS